jgi:hypothetical protein
VNRAADDATHWQVVLDRDAPPGNVLDALADLLLDLAERDRSATNHGDRTTPPREGQ